MSKRKKRIIILLMIVAVLVILWHIMFPRIYMRFFFITELAPVVDPPAAKYLKSIRNTADVLDIYIIPAEEEKPVKYFLFE